MIGNLLVDLENHSVKDNKSGSQLDGLNLLLFLSLVRHYPETVNYQIVEKEVWPDRHVSIETMNKRISLLKLRLKSLNCAHLIKTLPGGHVVLTESPVPIVSNSDDRKFDESQPTKQFSKVTLRLIMSLVILSLLTICIVMIFNLEKEPAVLYDPASGKRLVAPKS